MDEKTLEIMAEKAGLNQFGPCQFKGKCHSIGVGSVLCEGDYMACAFYGARVIEAWRARVRDEMPKTRTREPAYA